MSAALLILLLGGARALRPPLPARMGAAASAAVPLAFAISASPVASSQDASPRASATSADPAATAESADPTATVSRGSREWT